MKILLLFEYASLNGGEHSLLCLLPLLQQAGQRLEAAAPPVGPLAEALGKLKIEVLPFDATGADGKRLSQAARREQLASLIERSRPDLLHANSLAMTRLSGPVAWRAGVASVGHLRDIVGLSRQAVADCNCHGQLVAVSAATRDWHVAQGIEADRIEVAHNGVGLDRFQPRPRLGWLRRQLALPDDARLIGGVGQLGMRKGWDLLLKALTAIDLPRWDVHLTIAGERHSTKQEALDYEAALHEVADSEPLAGRVHWLGRCDEMLAFYNDLDLLVHPARQEPLGRVLLEAAAAGLPIIATEVGGTREIFPPGSDAAWIVEPDNPAALAAALRECLSERGRASRYGSRARAVVEQGFSQRGAAERLAEIYAAAAR